MIPTTPIPTVKTMMIVKLTTSFIETFMFFILFLKPPTIFNVFFYILLYVKQYYTTTKYKLLYCNCIQFVNTINTKKSVSIRKYMTFYTNLAYKSKF